MILHSLLMFNSLHRNLASRIVMRLCSLPRHANHPPCEERRGRQEHRLRYLHKAIRLTGKSVAIRDWDAQGTTSKALKAIGVEEKRAKKSKRRYLRHASQPRTYGGSHSSMFAHLSYYNIKDVML